MWLRQTPIGGDVMHSPFFSLSCLVFLFATTEARALTMDALKDAKAFDRNYVATVRG